MLLVVVFVILLCAPNLSQAEGVFQLQLLELFNYRGERLVGGCCGQRDPVTWSDVRSGHEAGTSCRRGRNSVASGTGVRPLECRTSFSVCLKQFQEPVRFSGACEFGNRSSAVLGADSFQLSPPHTITFPFSFSWLSFTLIISAWDNVGQDPDSAKLLIERTAYAGRLAPSDQWLFRSHHGHVARIEYKVRVQCAPDYYGPKCTRLCRPRNDLLGHYLCDSLGDRQCLQGWTGDNCDKAVCRRGCHPINGNCTEPGQCKCSEGWQGDLCDQCLPYPGCKHGDCQGRPLQCICRPKWGGMLCDQDLDYCSHHHPCVNGGTCHPANPGTYQCSCPEGFTGDHCQVAINNNSCSQPHPCLHGGTCLERAGHFHCLCARGWSGASCQNRVELCADHPCQHALTCRDLDGHFQCQCLPGWSGLRCHLSDTPPPRPRQSPLQPPPCSPSTCDTVGGVCVDGGAAGGSKCQCRPGFRGESCEEANCREGECQNGGYCSRQADESRCVCASGYMGAVCQHKAEPCAVSPCHPDSVCHVIKVTGSTDSIGVTVCKCAAGRHGPLCQLNNTDSYLPSCQGHSCQGGDACSSSPCSHGGTCQSFPGTSFTCSCPPEWTGATCTQRRRPGPDVLALVPSLDACVWRQAPSAPARRYRPGSVWRDRCNSCRCGAGGRVQCTRLQCEPRYCQSYSQCDTNEICAPVMNAVCLSAPCGVFGECRSRLTPGHDHSGHVVCRPGQSAGHVSGQCAQLQVWLQPRQLPVGVTLHSLCADLRRMLTDGQAERLGSRRLSLQCDMSADHETLLLVSLFAPDSAAAVPEIALSSELAHWLAAHLNSTKPQLRAVVTSSATSTDSLGLPVGSPGVSTVVTLVTSLLVAMAVVVSCLLAALLQHRRRVRTLQRQVSAAKLTTVSGSIDAFRVHNQLNNAASLSPPRHNRLSFDKSQRNGAAVDKTQLNAGFCGDNATIMARRVEADWLSNGKGGSYSGNHLAQTTHTINIKHSDTLSEKHINKKSVKLAPLSVTDCDASHHDPSPSCGEVIV